MRYVPGRKPRKRISASRRQNALPARDTMESSLFPGGDVRLLTSASPCAFSGDRHLSVVPPICTNGSEPPLSEADSSKRSEPNSAEEFTASSAPDTTQINETPEVEIHEMEEAPAPQPGPELSPDANQSDRPSAVAARQIVALGASKTVSLGASENKLMQNDSTVSPMPDEHEFVTYESEIQAATDEFRAAQNKKRAARRRELAAGRPSRKEREQSAELVRFPLDDAKAAFVTFARSVGQPSTSAPPPDLARHARRCLVCAHPDRDAIEGEFARWRNPVRIAEDYGIADRNSIYRHAHATGLLYRRRREAARVLEHVLERAESTPTEEFDVITRALRLYTCLDDEGRLREPVRTHQVLHGHLDQPAPPSPIDVASPAAPDDSLPD